MNQAGQGMKKMENKKPNNLPKVKFGLVKKIAFSQSNLPAKVSKILISAGLLTQASSYWPRLPVTPGVYGGKMKRSSAITVAGQWRIFTALPVHRNRV
jgi:hypothetical protein